MKITDRLAGDHKTFLKLIREITAVLPDVRALEDGGGADRLRKLTGIFKDTLVFHAWVEDRFYYPAVLRRLGEWAGSAIDADYLERLEGEHKSLDGALARLEQSSKIKPLASGWEAEFRAFISELESHMRKEEEELFPESERRLGAEELEALSADIDRHRAEAPRARPYK